VIRAAAKTCNRADVGIVFREARSRRSADVVVGYWDERCGGALSFWLSSPPRPDDVRGAKALY
jgi:hypothetical protein